MDSYKSAVSFSQADRSTMAEYNKAGIDEIMQQFINSFDDDLDK